MNMGKKSPLISFFRFQHIGIEETGQLFISTLVEWIPIMIEWEMHYLGKIFVGVRLRGVTVPSKGNNYFDYKINKQTSRSTGRYFRVVIISF